MADSLDADQARVVSGHCYFRANGGDIFLTHVTIRTGATWVSVRHDDRPEVVSDHPAVVDFFSELARIRRPVGTGLLADL